MSIASKVAARQARDERITRERRMRAQGWDGHSTGFGSSDPYARAASRREAFSKSSSGNVEAPSSDAPASPSGRRP